MNKGAGGDGYDRVWVQLSTVGIRVSMLFFIILGTVALIGESLKVFNEGVSLDLEDGVPPILTVLFMLWFLEFMASLMAYWSRLHDNLYVFVGPVKGGLPQAVSLALQEEGMTFERVDYLGRVGRLLPLRISRVFSLYDGEVLVHVTDAKVYIGPVTEDWRGVVDRVRSALSRALGVRDEVIFLDGREGIGYR